MTQNANGSPYPTGTESDVERVHSDTSAEVEVVQLRLLREKTPAERGAMALRISDEIVRSSKLAIQRAHPEYTAVQVGQLFVELHYGKELADALRRYQGSMEHR